MPAPARRGGYRVYTEQSVERLMFIKCAQQLGFKLKELQEILQGYEGDALPWDKADQAIANKKQALAMQIVALQNMHQGLLVFEAQLKAAQGECWVATKTS
ncbi:MerR family transcriptional regulator [Pseudomonas fluorescens]|nr:MerR family transcriptional regulator [Pseudomonas sp. WCS374]AOS75911.1 MerR family transcriptional regulator [Pseudomonas fluorescens]